MTVRFCTLFDSKYAIRGLTMLRSLETFCQADDELYVLAVDEAARRLLQRVGNSRWHILESKDLGDQELLEAERTRPRREFCWTCTPALSAWMVHNSADGDFVIYLDADLLFFLDPRILLAELDNGGSQLIHEHRFPPHRPKEFHSGRFNVGFVAFRVGAEARACAERWRAQTIELCVLDPDSGYCGDQGYLNDWPARYPNTRVMKNIGGGVAPWNVDQYRVGFNGRVPTVDGCPVVFFHYHSLRIVGDKRLGFIAVQPAYGYDFTRKMNTFIIRPYAKKLRKSLREAKAAGFVSDPDFTIGQGIDWMDFVCGVQSGRYVLLI